MKSQTLSSSYPLQLLLCSLSLFCGWSSSIIATENLGTILKEECSFCLHQNSGKTSHVMNILMIKLTFQSKTENWSRLFNTKKIEIIMDNKGEMLLKVSFIRTIFIEMLLNPEIHDRVEINFKYLLHFLLILIFYAWIRKQDSHRRKPLRSKPNFPKLV